VLAGPYRASVGKLTSSAETDALSAAEAPPLPGRLSIQHRDFPVTVAGGYADAALTRLFAFFSACRDGKLACRSWLP